MEPVADILDDMAIRCFAWRYGAIGWAACIILGLVLACSMRAAYKWLDSVFGPDNRYYATHWLTTSDDIPEKN